MKTINTVLAVVIILLLITHQICKPNRLHVLPHSTDMQVLQAAHMRALARVSQGDITIKSISNLKGTPSMWRACTSLNQLEGRKG